MRCLKLEWQIIDLALQGYQKITVSLYDTLGKDSVGESHLHALVINRAHLTLAIFFFRIHVNP